MSKYGCMSDQVANRCPESPPAAPRCPAVRGRPTVAWGVAMRCRAKHFDLAASHAASRASRVLLRLTACDDAARLVAPRRDVHRCPCRVPEHKRLRARDCDNNVTFPGRAPWPHVFLARRLRRREALQRAQRCDLAARSHICCRLPVSFRPCVLRRCGPHCRAVPLC